MSAEHDGVHQHRKVQHGYGMVIPTLMLRADMKATHAPLVGVRTMLNYSLLRQDNC